MDLKEIPDDLKTFGICLETVLQDGLALEYVPDELKTAIIEQVTENKEQ